MSDLNIKLILSLVDRATAPARAAMQSLGRINGEALIQNARRVDVGARLMAGGLQDIGRAARTASIVLASVAAAAAGAAAAFVRPAAQFEQYRVQLTNLEGSAEGATRALNWIEAFATRTPLELSDTVEAYAKLRAFGIDPTNGSMQALVDTMAATGGGAEQLNGLVLAVGQAWTKGKLQGEEALQMLERGVPVYDLLAEKMGKTTEEIVAMQSAGKLGREEIALLLEALSERNAGASEAMSKTWSGIISNLMDWWTRFQRMVMDSGLFDYMKGRLQQFLDLLNAMAADGRLQAYAERTGQIIILTLEKLWQFGEGVVGVWNALAPRVAYVSELLGGWDRLAWLGGAVLMRGMLWDLTTGFLKVGAGLLWVIRGLAGLAWALNPVTASIAAIAGLAFVIYRNWDGIDAWFTDKFRKIDAAANESILQGALAVVANWNPFTLLLEGAQAFHKFTTGMSFTELARRIEDELGIRPFTPILENAQALFDYVTAGAPNIGKHLADAFADSPAKRLWDKVREFYDWATNLDWDKIQRDLVAAFEGIDLYETGVAIINSLWRGIEARIDAMIGWIKQKLAGITPSWLGGGDVPVVGGGGGPGVTPGGATAGRALGGPVRAGQIYQWQERGLEFFSPGVDGRVIDNRSVQRMTGAARRAAGSVINMGGITVNAAPGMDANAVARAVRRELDAFMRTARNALHDGADYAV